MSSVRSVFHFRWKRVRDRVGSFLLTVAVALCVKGVVPRFILRIFHKRLSVIGPCGSPPEDVGRAGNGAGIPDGIDAVEPSDQLLVKISTQRQRPAGDLFKGLASEREAGVKSPCSIFFLNLPRVIAEHLRGLGP